MIVGVCMVRDEADIIGPVLDHLFAEGIGHVVVADNLSTDGTRDILGSYDDLTVVDDDDPAYYQALKTTRLAHLAGGVGAEWVLPFDADELWYAPGGTVAEVLSRTQADVVYADGWDHVVTAGDGDDPNPLVRIRHRRDHVQRFPKVAFRYHPSVRLHQGNHDVHHPGRRADSACGALSFRHFQWRSPEQFVRKARQGKAAYDLTDLPSYEGAHWRTLGALSDEELAARWTEMLGEPGLVDDPAPVRS